MLAGRLPDWRISISLGISRGGIPVMIPESRISVRIDGARADDVVEQDRQAILEGAALLGLVLAGQGGELPAAGGGEAEADGGLEAFVLGAADVDEIVAGDVLPVLRAEDVAVGHAVAPGLLADDGVVAGEDGARVVVDPIGRDASTASSAT